MSKFVNKQLKSKSRFHHLWSILQDLDAGKFDYSKSDQIFHKNVSLLSLSLFSQDIAIKINAMRLCVWLFTEPPLKNSLIKFIQCNGMIRFVHAIHFGISVLKVDVNQMLRDGIEIAILSFTQTACKSHVYNINKDIHVLKLLTSKILPNLFLFSDDCQKCVWQLILVIIIDYGSNRLNWNVLTNIENALISTYDENCPLFIPLVEEIGNILDELRYHRCELHRKPINVELFQITLRILHININGNYRDSVKTLLSVIFDVTGFEASKYTQQKSNEHNIAIQKSNLYPVVDAIINVVIKVFNDEHYIYTALGILRNILQFNTEFVFQKRYSINKDILLEVILKHLQHDNADIARFAFMCLQIIYGNSVKIYKHYLDVNQLKILKYTSNISVNLLKTDRKAAAIWTKYIFCTMENMKIRTLKLRSNIDRRLKLIQTEYIIFMNTQNWYTMSEPEKKEYYSMVEATAIVQKYLLKMCCFNCRKKRNKSNGMLLYKCKSCQYVKYCGKKCQKQDWMFHKLHCEFYY
eukprot:114417_1